MKMWKFVRDDGMNVDTYVVIAETAEDAAQKLNDQTQFKRYKAETFVEIKSGIFVGHEDRWPQA